MDWAQFDVYTFRRVGITALSSCKFSLVWDHSFSLSSSILTAHAEKAVRRCHKSSFEGSSLFVELKRGKNAPKRAPKSFTQDQQDRTLVVHGLNRKTTLAAMLALLSERFRSTGVIENIRIPNDREVDSNHRGYAFITFKRARQAKMSLQVLQNKTLSDGSKMIIDLQMDSKEYRKMRETFQAEYDREKMALKTVQRKISNIQQPRKAGQSRQEELQQAVFIKNIPLECVEKDLERVFARFGGIHYVALVKSNMTTSSGRFHKGCAFLRFKTVKSFENLFAYLEQRKVIFGNAGESSAFYTRHELKANDQVLHISRARENAKVKKKEEKDSRGRKKKKKSKPDKRNTALAREGHIHPNSAAATGIPPWLLRQLQQEYMEKIALLKKNPNIHVSRTRLRVSMIPQSISKEKELKKIFLAPFQISSSSIPLSEVYIRQVKLLKKKKARQHNGVGFVEFEKHEHAIHALQRVNNNPHVLKGGKRLYVCFALVDVTKLLKKDQARRKRKFEPGNSVVKNDHKSKRRKLKR